MLLKMKAWHSLNQCDALFLSITLTVTLEKEEADFYNTKLKIFHFELRKCILHCRIIMIYISITTKYQVISTDY